ncbi:MAG TPA: zinc ribbon domain-containing protein [Ktedonobacteraceae bacterium]|nr:zinc ribbon domain-containing protein [Ktedonobacteraceae bacterium]
MRTTIVKGCLYCGLRLPEDADFCPECGRPIEVTIRVDSNVKMRTTMAKGCLNCSLQLPENADYCPECGRPIEKGLITHATQHSESDCLDKEVEGKGELVRRHAVSLEDSAPLADETTPMHDEHARVNPIPPLTMVAAKHR